MAELQDTDKFLVNRSGNSYQLTTENLMAELRDDDLMLVNRAGVSYKATGLEIKESIDTGPTGSIETPVAVLTPLNGAGTNAGQPYQPLSTAITAVGAGGSAVYSTDTIASVNPPSNWNQSEIWSNQVTSGATTANPNTFGFDGKDTTELVTDPSRSDVVWACNLTNVTSLKIRVKVRQAGSPTTTVSGTGITSTDIAPSQQTSLVNIPLTSTTVSNIRISAGGASLAMTLCQVEVNGAILVDTGVGGPRHIQPSPSQPPTTSTSLKWVMWFRQVIGIRVRSGALI